MGVSRGEEGCCFDGGLGRGDFGGGVFKDGVHFGVLFLFCFGSGVGSCGSASLPCGVIVLLLWMD